MNLILLIALTFSHVQETDDLTRRERSGTLSSISDEDVFNGALNITDLVMRRKARLASGASSARTSDPRQSRIVAIADEMERQHTALSEAQRRVAELEAENVNLRDAAALLRDNNTTLQEVVDGKMSARTAAAVVDASQARLAKIRDRLKADMRRTPSDGALNKHGELQGAADVLAEFQSDLAAMRADLVGTIKKLTDDNKELEERLAAVLQERDDSMDQLSVQRKSRAHDLNTSRRAFTEIVTAEAPNVDKKETSELHKQLIAVQAELEGLRSQLAQSKQTKDFLEDALLGYEDESKEQYDKMTKLQASSVDAEHRLTEKQAQIEALEHQTKQLEASLQLARSGMGETKGELQALRRERDELRVVNEELKRQRADAVAQREDAVSEAHRTTEWLENITKNYEALQSSSSAREQQLHGKVCNLQQELSSTKTILHEKQQIIETELMAGHHERHDEHQELLQTKRDLLEAKRIVEEIQGNSDLLALQLQGELALRLGTADTSGMSAMSMTELFDSIKSEHTKQVTGLQQAAKASVAQHAIELDAKLREIAELQGQLEERNVLLTRVMEFLRNEDLSHDASSKPKDERVKGLLEHAELLTHGSADRTKLLEQYDNETATLSSNVDFWKQRFHELKLANQSLESRLSLKSAELEQALHQPEGSKVKANTITEVHQSRQVVSQTSEVFETQAAAPALAQVTRDSDQSIELSNLRKEIALLKKQLEESRRQHMQALRDMNEERRAAKSAREHESVTTAPALSLADELALSNESDKEEQIKSLKADIQRLTSQLEASHAELHIILHELIDSNLTLRLASEKGSTNVQLIAQLKELFADETLKLQLRADELASHDRTLRLRLQELVIWQPAAADVATAAFDHSDIVAALKHRLHQLISRQAELEKLLTEHASSSLKEQSIKASLWVSFAIHYEARAFRWLKLWRTTFL